MIIILFILQAFATEVCFSPDQPCDEKLSALLSEAKKSISIAIYDINLEQVIHQLIKAKLRGVNVRVVADKRQSKGSHSAVSTLVKANVPVRFGRQRGIMHDKFTIVDDQTLQTGSFNYTHHAATANQENQIYLTDLEVIKKFGERFEKIWMGAGPTIPRRVSSEN